MSCVLFARYGMKALVVRFCYALVWSAMFCCQSLRAADFIVKDRDDVLTLISKIHATQFLSHATFGPTQAEVDQLAAEMRRQGTLAAASAWIERQTDKILTPPSLHTPKQEWFIATDLANWTLDNGGVPNSSNTPNPSQYRQAVWWHHAITGRDQLRQKMAWALSQIFAVGSTIEAFDGQEFESTVSGGPISKSRFLGLSNYYDVFVDEAFSKYRDVLGKVTYHSIMGNWLSYVGNRRAQNGMYPDENFAREVMQLFTIGLYLLSDNGERQTNSQGVISTYGEKDVRDYAKVFTGLGYGYGVYAPNAPGVHPNSPYTGGDSVQPNGFLKFQVPMRMAAAQHDPSTKFLLNGQVILNPFGPGVEHSEASANQEISTALDGLVNHQSCPPFIARRLIQRFVKSNPSKDYLQRVVSVFKNNGYGQRGDLKAVIRAVLLDPEAWQQIRIQYHRGIDNRIAVSTIGTEDARLQEPVANYVRFLRFFKAWARYQRSTDGSFRIPTLISNEFRLRSRYEEFEQSPYLAPSVFNFYLPDYQPISDLLAYKPSDRIPNNTVVAPEFQLVNSITSNRTGNFYRRCVIDGYRIESHQYRGQTSQNFAGVVTRSLESTRTVVSFDFFVEQDLLKTEEGIDQLLERLDLYLCGGTLNAEYKSTLRSLLSTEWSLAMEEDFSEAKRRDIAKGAILAILTAPSFLVSE